MSLDSLDVECFEFRWSTLTHPMVISWLRIKIRLLPSLEVWIYIIKRKRLVFLLIRSYIFCLKTFIVLNNFLNSWFLNLFSCLLSSFHHHHAQVANIKQPVSIILCVFLDSWNHRQTHTCTHSLRFFVSSYAKIFYYV